MTTHVKSYQYILGIDLGIASIGTALIRLDKVGNIAGILDAGVRIFDIANGAVECRMARQSRTVIAHRRERLRTLRNYLQSNNVLPKDEKLLAALMCRSPYRLRAFGVQNPFRNVYDLGRSLMHMAKFRGAGFMVQAEEDQEGQDEADNASVTKKSKKDSQRTAVFYRRLEQIIHEEKITLGEFYMRRLRAGGAQICLRRRERFLNENIVDYAVPRFLVQDDFHALWDCQAKNFSILTDEIKSDIYKIIFSDKPRAPYATGVCSMDPASGEERLPRMHRLAEERRIYEQINNLRYTTNIADHVLTKAMRDALVVRALAGETLNKKTTKKYLQAFTTDKILSVNMDSPKGIVGLSHVTAFASIAAWQDFSQEEQDDFIAFITDPRINPDDVNSALMPDDDALQVCVDTLRLCENGQNARDNKRLLAARLEELPKDRSALGITATTRILEKLKEGAFVFVDGVETWRPISAREAADACGYTAEEEKHRAMAGSYEALPYYGEILSHDVTPVHPWHSRRASAEEAKYGRVPNPVVHMVLNQLRKVLNEIVALYGKPQRIHIELAREFGMSAKRRDEIDKENKKNERDNEILTGKLHGLGLPANRKNRRKYRLWEEQGGVDIYTLKGIQAKDFNSYEIDHMIPRALGGSDTFSNLVLTAAEANLAKGDSFPYDFIQRVYPNNWGEILKKIRSSKYPKSKAWRFHADAQAQFGEIGDEEQTDRRLSDTSYMAKMAMRYVSALCANVVPIRGAMTSQLRHLWGLDALEYELAHQIVHKELIDEKTGVVAMDPYTDYTRPLPNPLWKAKPRIDHRHHALDAIVLACASRSLAQKMARCERLGKRIKDLAPPFVPKGEVLGNAGFRRSVLAALQDVKVSMKPEHGLGGKLHDATKYRVLCASPKNPDKHVIMYNRKLDALKKKSDVANIVFGTSTLPIGIEAIEKASAQCVLQRQYIESMYAQAEESLQNRNKELQAEGNRVFPIREEHIVQEAVKLTRKQYRTLGHSYASITIKSLVGVSLKRQCGFEPRGNFCMDFFIKADSSVGWECITRFDANQKGFEPQWKKEGCKHIWSLWKGDIFELVVDDALKEKLQLSVSVGKILFVVQKYSDGILQFNLLNDARTLKEIDGQKRWISGNTGLATFTKAQARKVELTPFGKVHRKHAKLWHGKKANKAR